MSPIKIWGYRCIGCGRGFDRAAERDAHENHDCRAAWLVRNYTKDGSES